MKDDSVALPVLLGIGIFHWLRANFALSVRYFEDLLLRAQHAEDALMIFAAAVALAMRCIQVCDEQGLPYWANYARVAIGIATARKGDHAAGIAMIEKGIADMEELGSLQSTPWLGILWAEAMLLAGRAEAVYETMIKNLDLIERTGNAWHAPMTYFMIGRAWLDRPDGNVSNAEAAFRKSIEHARTQESKTVELRASAWIARLWQSQGRHQEAYGLLAPVYDWFTEGFDTTGLIDAKMLLEGLSQECVRRQV